MTTKPLDPKPALLRLLNWIAEGRRYFMIKNADGSPYLLRILLRGYISRKEGEPKDTTPYRLNIYLHRFFSHDYDRDTHSHPWAWSFSVVLWGGYIEEKRNKRTGISVIRRVWPGMINILGPQDFHRVIELKGRETWTLFFTGGRASVWGFLVNGLFVRAREYLTAKGYAYDEPTPPGTPLPDWLLTCACCSGRFPPPGNYYVRVPGRAPRRAVRAPVCDSCARLPYSTDPDSGSGE